jgi:hypothetical protein
MDYLIYFGNVRVSHQTFSRVLMSAQSRGQQLIQLPFHPRLLSQTHRFYRVRTLAEKPQACVAHRAVKFHGELGLLLQDSCPSSCYKSYRNELMASIMLVCSVRSISRLSRRPQNQELHCHRQHTMHPKTQCLDHPYLARKFINYV